MVDSTSNSGQTVLDRFFIHCLPQRTSTYIGEVLLGVDPHLIQMPGEIDDESSIGRRGTCRVVASSTDCDGKMTGTGKCDGERDVVGCADESNELWTALCVGSPTCDGNGVVGVSRCDEVTGKVRFEVSEIGHSEDGELILR